jgi:hypothetical protein
MVVVVASCRVVKVPYTGRKTATESQFLSGKYGSVNYAIQFSGPVTALTARSVSHTS